MLKSRDKLLMCVFVTFLATGASFWKAPFPNELRLQHIPTVVGLIGVGIIIQREWLGSRSVLCLIAFIWLHLIGARWIYSFVPYDRWGMQIFGASISEVCGWQRNHYDRFVHLASGVLFVPPIWEVLEQQGLKSPRVLAAVAVSMVLAIGAVYEIFEWAISMTFAPAYAESYNGQQGDTWDPQKDMALAGLGAILAAAWIWSRSPGVSSAKKA